MALTSKVSRDNVSLSPAEEVRLERQLRGLERRLAHFPEPLVELTLARHEGPRRIDVDLRLRLEPHGRHLISHQSAETADQAVRLAIQDVKRELERQKAAQRGEPSFGVPSRRPPTWE
jgi:ribosome-associated translation inhibitor RaiA